MECSIFALFSSYLYIAFLSFTGIAFTVLLLLHALPRRHPSRKPNKVSPAGETTRDTDDLLWHVTLVKGWLWTMSGPDSLDIGPHSRKNLLLNHVYRHVMLKSWIHQYVVTWIQRWFCMRTCFVHSVRTFLGMSVYVAQCLCVKNGFRFT